MKRRLRSLAGTLERTDPFLLVAVAALLCLGIFVVYGAGSFNRQAAHSPLGQHYIIVKHLMMIAVGLVLMVGLVNVDPRWLRSRWVIYAGLALGLGLVGLTVLNKGGRSINRWIDVAGFSVQPVEVAKIALILFMAERLNPRGAGARPGRWSLATLLAVGLVPMLALLALQPNFGNVMVMLGVTVVMLALSDLPARWRAAVLVLPAVGALGVYAVSGKVQNRIAGLISGLREGQYEYQVKQSLTGLGAGGWNGLGVGQSHNKFAFLPESHTDFIYSLVGEEFGLLGTLTVIAALVVIIWRGYGIAGRASDGFGRSTAAGLTTALAIYGVANIAMVTGIFPVVGVPLPFVSYGGTAMIGGLASIGLLLNIERQSRGYHLWKRRWDRSGNS